MKEQPLPSEPYWQIEYSTYNAFACQLKPVMLSAIFRENVNLGKVALRLVREEKAIGIKSKIGGKKDMLVYLK